MPLIDRYLNAQQAAKPAPPPPELTDPLLEAGRVSQQQGAQTIGQWGQQLQDPRQLLMMLSTGGTGSPNAGSNTLLDALIESVRAGRAPAMAAGERAAPEVAMGAFGESAAPAVTQPVAQPYGTLFKEFGRPPVPVGKKAVANYSEEMSKRVSSPEHPKVWFDVVDHTGSEAIARATGTMHGDAMHVTLSSSKTGISPSQEVADKIGLVGLRDLMGHMMSEFEKQGVDVKSIQAFRMKNKHHLNIPADRIRTAFKEAWKGLYGAAAIAPTMLLDDDDAETPR